MGEYKNLIAFKKGYQLALEIFRITKTFPADERFSMTDQIRRSSRSVCANIAEAYKRRKYKNYFIAKLNDAETENTEVQVWLDFSKDCNYLSLQQYLSLKTINDEVGKLLSYMLSNPEKFL